MKENWEIHWKDYYKILQVHPSAEQEVIKAAYDRLARKYHPDMNKNPSSDQTMKDINEAFEVLGNLESRRLYHPIWLEKRRDTIHQQAPPERSPNPANSESYKRQEQEYTNYQPPPRKPEPSVNPHRSNDFVVGVVIVCTCLLIILFILYFAQSGTSTPTNLNPIDSVDKGIPSVVHQTPVQPVPPDMEWKRYTNAVYGYSIDVPLSWEMGEASSEILYFTAKDDSATGCAIIIQNNMQLVSSELYSQVVSNEFGQAPIEKTILPNSLTVYEFTGDFVSNNHEKGKGKGIVFIDRGIGYRLYMATSLSQYESYEPIFDHIIQSLVLSSSPSVIRPWNKYQSTNYPFSFEYPNDWLIKTDNMSVSVFSQWGQTAVVVSIDPPLGTLNFNDVLDLIIGRHVTIDKASLISKEEILIQGISSMELVYSFSDNATRYLAKDVIIPAKSQTYVFTFIAHPETQGIYDSIFEKMMTKIAVQ